MRHDGPSGIFDVALGGLLDRRPGCPRIKQDCRVAPAHALIASIRQDALSEASTETICTFGAIGVEKLHLSGMITDAWSFLEIGATFTARVPGVSGAVCKPMPAPFLATYRVVLPEIDHIVGWIRLDVSGGRWIARTPGDPYGHWAATIQRFEDRSQAIDWLVSRDPARRPAQPAP